MKYKLDPTFKERIGKTFGEAGRAWLKDLPNRLAGIAERWELRLGDAREPLSYNFVCEAKQADGQAAILKVGVPLTENRTEMAALGRFAGQGYVRLLRSDGEAGAMLLERLRPGQDVLAVEGDEAQTRIGAEVLAKHPVVTEDLKGFPSVADWGRGFARVREMTGGGDLPAGKRLFERAEGLYGELSESQDEACLLHGDLHHMNVLKSGENEWKVIDPKGIVGERAYEMGAWMRNPLHLLGREDAKGLIQRRMAIFSEHLGLERERMEGWALAQCVLAACWSREEGNKSERLFAEWAEELEGAFLPRQL